MKVTKILFIFVIVAVLFQSRVYAACDLPEVPNPFPGYAGRVNVFGSNFNTPGDFGGWLVWPGRPGNVTVNNGYLQLESFNSDMYPIVYNFNIPWPSGNLEIEFCFSSPNAASSASWGVNTWITYPGPTVPNIGSFGIYGGSGGYIWTDTGGSTIHDTLDTDWHKATIIRHGGTYDFYLDNILKLSNTTIASGPEFALIGDTTTQAWLGNWPTLRIDNFSVYNLPAPTATPTPIDCHGTCSSPYYPPYPNSSCRTNHCIDTTSGEGIYRCENPNCIGDSDCVCDPTPTPLNSPTPTPVFPPAWIQVRGGDVHVQDKEAFGTVFDFPIPAGKSFMESINPADTSKLSVGVFSTYSSVEPVLNGYNLSARIPVKPKGLYAGSHMYDNSALNGNMFDAQYWETNFSNLNPETYCEGGGAKILKDGLICGNPLVPNKMYIIDEGFNINENPFSANMGTQVIVVKNTIHIQKDIPSVPGTYPLIVATSNLHVHEGAAEINGVFISGNNDPGDPSGFIKFTGDTQLIIRGTVVAYRTSGGGSVQVERDLGSENAVKPAVVFEYNPRYLIGISNSLGMSKYIWEEVAP